MPRADPSGPRRLLAQLDSPHQRLIVLLAGVHALRTSQLRTLTLDDVDLATGRLLVDGQPRPLDALTRAELVAWLAQRRDRWPTSANPHLLVNTYTAGGPLKLAKLFGLSDPTAIR